MYVDIEDKIPVKMCMKQISAYRVTTRNNKQTHTANTQS